ncbi:hypothetical protein [Legionella sp. 227]|uniref:hypothetical protein n=1 Tax=Legionella sp. 227 TaxID=3367288 RepID=UPI00370D9380
MNTIGFRTFLLIGLLFLGYGLTSCTTPKVSSEAQPGYDGGFGGDGGHVHQNE